MEHFFNTHPYLTVCIEVIALMILCGFMFLAFWVWDNYMDEQKEKFKIKNDDDYDTFI